MRRDVYSVIGDFGPNLKPHTKSVVEWPEPGRDITKTDAFVENHYSVPECIYAFLGENHIYDSWPKWHPGGQTNLVKSGSPVVLLIDGVEETRVLTGPQFPVNGIISMETPLGKSIFNKPAGYKTKVGNTTVQIKEILSPRKAQAILEQFNSK